MLVSERQSRQVPPKILQAAEAAERRAPQRCVANEQFSRKATRTGLQKRVEGSVSGFDERMSAGQRIDGLLRDHLEPRVGTIPEREVRQMRVQIECADALQNTRGVQIMIHPERGRGTISGPGRTESEQVLDPKSQRLQEGPSKSSDALLCGYQRVPVVLKFDLLRLRRGRGAHIVMGADDEALSFPLEKIAEQIAFRARGLLARSEMIKADHDQRIDVSQEGIIELPCGWLVCLALNDGNVVAGLLADEFAKSLEIRQHDVVEEASNPLVEACRVTQLLDERP